MPSRFYIEKRSLQGGKSLSWDLAQHLSTRYGRSAAVIAENPAILMASVSKQWQKAVRQVRRARSGTLNAALIHELTQQLSSMEGTRMMAESPAAMTTDDSTTNVYFLTPEQALAQPPSCPTFYCTVPLITGNLETVTAKLPTDALVIVYE